MSEEILQVGSLINHNAITLESLENNVGKPYVGQTFVDLEEAYSFYRNYAKGRGFDIRKSSQKAYYNKRTGLRETVMKVYVCNKEGAWNETYDEDEASSSLVYSSQNGTLSQSKRRRTGSFRCGCKASLTVRIDFESKMWTITCFKEEHNHLLTSPTKKHFMKHNREVTVSMSNFIDIMESVGFSNSQISRLINVQQGGFDKSDVMMSDIRNFRRDKREDIKNYDADILLEHFQKIQLKDNKFFYAYKVDEESRLMHLFWADSTSKQDYELFGEAMTFDTTFKTN